MEGLVKLYNNEETHSLLDAAISIAENVSSSDMEVCIENKIGWSMSKLFTLSFGFYKYEEEYKILNFLMQDKNSVIKHIKELKRMLSTGNVVYVSTTSYNEIVKLADGDIEVNTIWLMRY